MTPSPDLIARFAGAIRALPINHAGPFGIAVSGGPDSLALLLLAAAAAPRRVRAATVDHRLRPEAAAEAAFVAAICTALAVPHIVLAPAEPIAGNIQAGARCVRYRLLDDWAATHALAAVATAHHVDDQAETLLMRLIRGSGAAGLAGIRAVTTPGRVAVIRPLLGWRHAELAQIVADAGITAIEDPGNRDERFTRARVRQALANSPWLDPPALARSAAALAEAEEALDWATKRLLADRLHREDGATILDPTDLPPDILRRLVLAALSHAGAVAPPRGPDIQRLIAALRAGDTRTLGGIRVVPGALWRFAPAPPHRH